ncbi:MAG TPA: hypothetical protein VKD43_04240 [Xanthobacteraceae bacterium]|nr:hypothetical protein [Xanthobacteraceae bacterium]
MGRLFKILKSSIWLLLWSGLVVQSANAQSERNPPVPERYPPVDDAWDGTSYRALVERVETEGLPLPTLSDAATKPVFQRMVNVDNIPLRMGLNRNLSVTIRFQRLDSALPAIHKLVVLYLNATQKGKPYAQELARLMVYESKVSAALLDLSEPYLSTLQTDKRYQVHVAYHEQVKSDARQLYSGLVRGMSETRRYSKSDILRMIEGALDGLPSYQPLFADQDRSDLVQMLTQQISTTSDRELKTALAELRDAIKHRRVRT